MALRKLHLAAHSYANNIVAGQAHPALKFLPMLVLVSSHVYECRRRLKHVNLFNGLKGRVVLSVQRTSLARDNILKTESAIQCI